MLPFRLLPQPRGSWSGRSHSIHLLQRRAQAPGTGTGQGAPECREAIPASRELVWLSGRACASQLWGLGSTQAPAAAAAWSLKDAEGTTSFLASLTHSLPAHRKSTCLTQDDRFDSTLFRPQERQSHSGRRQTRVHAVSCFPAQVQPIDPPAAGCPHASASGSHCPLPCAWETSLCISLVRTPVLTVDPPHYPKRGPHFQAPAVSTPARTFLPCKGHRGQGLTPAILGAFVQPRIP